jgi:hypothetical protein
MQFEYPATSVLFSIYGAATVAHGSGFLAVFVAGILAGDARAPYKREIERFHAALASLADIVAFIALGLTIGLHTLPNRGAWGIGLVLAVLLTLVVRPLLVGLLLLPVRLAWGERLFVLWAGLKGAVPILLGTFLLTAGEPDATRLYGVIVVVVAFSVVVQGSLVPTVADRLRVPMQPIQPEPWSLGVRLRHEPSGLRCYLIAAGAPADGCTIADLAVGEDVWISVVIRDGHLVPVHGSTRLQAGDEVLALTDPEHQNLTPVFAPPAEPARYRLCAGLLSWPGAIEMDEPGHMPSLVGRMLESKIWNGGAAPIGVSGMRCHPRCDHDPKKVPIVVDVTVTGSSQRPRDQVAAYLRDRQRPRMDRRAPQRTATHAGTGRGRQPGGAGRRLPGPPGGCRRSASPDEP